MRVEKMDANFDWMKAEVALEEREREMFSSVVSKALLVISNSGKKRSRVQDAAARY